MLNNVLLNHYKKYPKMQLQDFFKLIFQNNFGSDHMCLNKDVVSDMLQDEWANVAPKDVELFTDIGNGYSRINISAAKYKNINPLIIERLFCLSGSDNKKDMSCFYSDVSILKELCNNGVLPFSDASIDEFINTWKEGGCRPISHSHDYKKNYSPSYRVIKTVYATYFQLIQRIFDYNKNIVVAIDGRCASGKSTLASILSEVFDCNIIHADDFFLPPDKRTPERYHEAGGNFDYERFSKEIIGGLKSGDSFKYRKFSCFKNDFDGEVIVTPKKFTIVEGSYCMNPNIEDIYDVKVFISTNYKTQLDRIEKRNGVKCLWNFKTRWIPYEEKYFSECKIKEKCDFVYKT